MVGLAFCFGFVVVIGFVIVVLHFSFFVVYCNVCFVLRCCGCCLKMRRGLCCVVCVWLSWFWFLV